MSTYFIAMTTRPVLEEVIIHTGKVSNDLQLVKDYNIQIVCFRLIESDFMLMQEFSFLNIQIRLCKITFVSF